MKSKGKEREKEARGREMEGKGKRMGNEGKWTGENKLWKKMLGLGEFIQEKNNVSFPYFLPATATWEAEDPLALQTRVKEVLTANED